MGSQPEADAPLAQTPTFSSEGHRDKPSRLGLDGFSAGGGCARRVESSTYGANSHLQLYQTLKKRLRV